MAFLGRALERTHFVGQRCVRLLVPKVMKIAVGDRIAWSCSPFCININANVSARYLTEFRNRAIVAPTSAEIAVAALTFELVGGLESLWLFFTCAEYVPKKYAALREMQIAQ